MKYRIRLWKRGYENWLDYSGQHFDSRAEAVSFACKRFLPEWLVNVSPVDEKSQEKPFTVERTYVQITEGGEDYDRK